MTTFNDWVEKVYRRVNGTAIDVNVQLTGAMSAYDISFIVSSTSIGQTALRANAILAVDFEMMLVLGWDNGSNTVTVQRGYNGSVAASHAMGTLAYVQPRYSRFDISVALNDELNRLSSPDMGLFQVKHQDITFNPVYMGYDLTQAVNDNFIDVMEVRYKIPFPTRNYPAIHRWKVLRSIGDTTTFPSGAGSVFYEGGYPGQPVYVQYSAPFSTVDITASGALTTDVTTLTGMTKTMADIPPLGVEIQLTLPREIRRNFTDIQPDPRKALEIPSLAVSNSVQALAVLYNQRVSEEAGRLSRQYTRVEGY
jgi:hypothetical protein